MLALPLHARAQTPAPKPEPSRLSVRTPPRIEYLPELELPEGLAVPAAALEATVRVEIDGRASLEESSATGELRARIEAVLAHARFVPARINDAPTTARVRLRFAVHSAQPEPAGQVTQSEAAPGRKTTMRDLDRDQLGARAEVDPPKPAARRLQLAEMRDVPGAFGDPFRVLDTLPGVVPVFSGLPYVYVRGAPPAGTIYVYDGIAMPSLFHLALGPAVIHATMIGDLQFYAAVPPARYGRRTGGVFAAEGKKPDPSRGTHGEVELRLLDVSGMIDAPLSKTDKRHRLQLAGRYGYPGLLLSIFAEDVALAYWDYQLRYSVPISHIDRVEVTWFGSYDYVGEADDPNNDSNFSLEFHRAEARVLRERENFELGFALQGGYEESSLGEEVGVYAWRLGPRLWTAIKLSDDVRMRAGMEMLAAIGAIYSDESDLGGGPSFETPSTDGAVVPAGTPPFVPNQQVPPDETPEFSPFDNPLFADVAGRNLAGVYLELELDVTDEWVIAPGLRADAWLTGALLTGARAQTALEPRLVTTYQPDPEWQLHAGGGLGHQVAALPIALPGFNDVALERGLQRSISTEAGIAYLPTLDWRLESTLFYNHLTGLLVPDLFIDCADSGDAPLCDTDGSIPRGQVDAYGLELFLKRNANAWLSGWLSYTLAWADGESERGTEFTPSFDVRHVGNLVLQWNMGKGFSLGGRAHYRSGKVASESVFDPLRDPSDVVYFRYERRLPAFFRADAQLIYAWTNSWAKMRVSLEWMNLTLSREALDVTCNEHSSVNGMSTQTDCGIEYAPAIFFPSLGLRAEL
jgi:hypothetical protein